MILAPVNEHSNLRWLWAGWVVLLLFQLGCFVFYLGHFRYLPGTDAYYYALQAQSLADSGHPKVADGDAVPYLIAAISRLGLSIEASFRLALIAIYATYNVGLLLFLIRYGQKNHAIATLLWLVSSPAIAFHTVEFPKLTLALALVPIWFCLLASHARTRILWLSLLAGTCCLLHPAVIVPALLFVSTVALGWVRATRDGGKRLSARNLTWVFTGIALYIFAIAIEWSRLAPRIGRLQGGEPAIFSLVETEGLPFDLKLAIILLWFVLGFSFLSTVFTRPERWVYLTVATLAFPLWPNYDGGFFGTGSRYALMFVFFAVPLILLVRQEMEGVSASISLLRVSWPKRMLWIVAPLLLFIFPARLRSYNGLLASQNYAAYESVVSSIRTDDVPMLIAHRGLDFFYSYRLRRDAFHFDPEPGWNRSDIWRVALRITPEEVAYYSPAECPWGETARRIPGTAYLLIREDCWEQLRANINQNDNPDLYMEVWQDAENPSQPRPAFLRGRHHGDADSAFPAFADGRE
jgi:hypothetical protein